MADATDQGDVVITEASDDAQQEQATPAVAGSEVNAAEARIKELEAELNKSRDILEKARKGEKYAKQTKQQLEEKLAELEAQGDWKSKYEQLVQRENTRVVDTALSEALANAAKPENVKAAMKLVDRSALQVVDGVVDAKAVETAVLKAREEFPSLFVEVKTPAPVRAAEGAVTGGFEKELAAAKTQADITAVLKRHGLV
ncbi:hypothetical protein WG922_07705 [Ramlibacter sp. AN1015]|uniref:hypothetical protein n=1 Tax=Ramlibacter sp. AN1015 TaxID=3133428 RepID=UPI0030C5A0A0